MLTRRLVSQLVTVLLLLPCSAAAAPLGRGFTYQGKLSQSGVPVNSPVTLRFSLWNMAGSGNPPVGGDVIGGVQILPNVPVNDGIFSVELNGNDEFGSAAFNGEARWLQVEVCGDAGCTTATVLSPRQALTGSPYALGPWQLSDTSISYSAGRVGIGTASPVATLHVKTAEQAVHVEGAAVGISNTAWIGFGDAGGTTSGWVGDGSSQDSHTYLSSYANDVILYTSVGAALTAKPNANVGIGTANPLGKLDVRGDIRLGSSGQYRAAGGAETLRLVRGSVRGTNGTILAGSGFTASRVLQGTYRVTYSTAFDSGPSVTVTPRLPAGGAIRFVQTWNVDTTGFNVTIYLSGGTLTDSDFDFCVMGPQ